MGREEIQDRADVSLVDAVSRVPGAWVETRGRKVKQFVSLRGQAYPYPDYTVDGIWQREFHEMPFFLAAANVGGLTVNRSASALLYGPHATVGVIDIEPFTPTGRVSEIDARYGSWNAMAVRTIQGEDLGHTQWAFGLGHTRNEGPEDKNASEHITDIYGRLVTRPSEDVRLAFTAMAFDGFAELRKAEPPATTQLQNELSRYDPYRAVLLAGTATYAPEGARASTEFGASWGMRDHMMLKGTVADPGTVTANSEGDSEWTFTVRQGVRLTDANALRIGATFNHWIAPEGKRFYAGRRCDLETWSLFVVDEHTAGRLALSAGWRVDRTYIGEFGGFGIEGAQPGDLKNVEPIVDVWEPAAHSAYLGSQFNFAPDQAVSAALTVGSIEPRPGSLNAALEAPDSELRTNLDLGWQLRRAEYQFAATVFATLRKDGIVLSGGTEEIEPGVFIELYENRDQLGAGVELEARGGIAAGLDGFANAVFMTNRELVAGEWETNDKIPSIIVNAGLSGRRGRAGWTFSAKAVGPYENNRFVQGGVMHPLGDFVTFDATASIDLSESSTAYVKAENITNVKYETVAGYPDFGFRMQAGLRASF